MAYIELNSQQTNIVTGTTQNISISGYNSSYPLQIQVAGAIGSIRGLCTGNKTSVIFPGGTYVVQSGTQGSTFTHSFSANCSSNTSMTSTLHCVVNGNTLQCTFSCSHNGKTFLEYVYPEFLTITSVGYDNPNPTSWQTITSTPFSISGGYDSTNKTLPGLLANKQTRITVSSGYYSCYEQLGGNYGEVEPEWCDGGCYCYCEDGSQIEDGGMCYGITDTYYETTESSIYSGTYTSVGGTITLSTSYGVTNPTITVSENTLTFNGYRSGGTDEEKYIYITKVEQYY